MVAAIWAQVMQLDQVGMEENFFGLGGHSLLAMQVMSRIRQVFAVELQLRSFLENPTVATLALLWIRRPRRRCLLCYLYRGANLCACRLRRSACGLGAL